VLIGRQKEPNYKKISVTLELSGEQKERLFPEGISGYNLSHKEALTGSMKFDLFSFMVKTLII
jgi:hypothetical protein